MTANSMVTRNRPSTEPTPGSLPQGRAQVPPEHIPQPAPVLNVYWPVETQRLAIAALFLENRPAVAFPTRQDRQGRVSRDDPEESEHRRSPPAAWE